MAIKREGGSAALFLRALARAEDIRRERLRIELETGRRVQDAVSSRTYKKRRAAYIEALFGN